MPLFAVMCKDKTNHLQMRKDNRPAHLDYLAQSPDTVRMAGALLDGDAMIGSLLVIEAEDEAAAAAWAENDPYHKAGLFQSREIRKWNKVIG